MTAALAAPASASPVRARKADAGPAENSPRTSRRRGRDGGEAARPGWGAALLTLLILAPPPAHAQAPGESAEPSGLGAPNALERGLQPTFRTGFPGGDATARIIPPQAAAGRGGRALERRGPVTPAADPCQKETLDPEAHAITITNLCDSAVSLEYMTSETPGVVRRDDLDPGYGLRARDLAGQPGRWWLWTACPKGYVSTVKLSLANRAAISTGAYQCARR